MQKKKNHKIQKHEVHIKICKIKRFSDLLTIVTIIFKFVAHLATFWTIKKK